MSDIIFKSPKLVCQQIVHQTKSDPPIAWQLAAAPTETDSRGCYKNILDAMWAQNVLKILKEVAKEEF